MPLPPENEFLSSMYYSYQDNGGQLADRAQWAGDYMDMLQELTENQVYAELFLPFLRRGDLSRFGEELTSPEPMVRVREDGGFAFTGIEFQEVGAALFKHAREGKMRGIEVVSGGNAGLLENQEYLLMRRKGKEESYGIRGVVERGFRRAQSAGDRLVRFDLVLPSGVPVGVAR